MCEGGGPIILINTTTLTHVARPGSIAYLYMKLPPREMNLFILS